MIRNISTSNINPVDSETMQNIIKEWERRLGTHGRILVRPSGTEPLIRIMAEGKDSKLLQEAIESIEKALLKG